MRNSGFYPDEKWEQYIMPYKLEAHLIFLVNEVEVIANAAPINIFIVI